MKSERFSLKDTKYIEIGRRVIDGLQISDDDVIEMIFKKNSVEIFVQTQKDIESIIATINVNSMLDK